MATILLIGEDDSLIHTRSAVLRTTGAQILNAKPESALQTAESARPHVVVLCHTVKDPAVVPLVARFRASLPETHILRMTSLRNWESRLPGDEVEPISSADPWRLVRRVSELLCIAPGARTRRSSPPDSGILA